MKLLYIITGILIISLATMGIVSAGDDSGCGTVFCNQAQSGVSCSNQIDPWYGWETELHPEGYAGHAYTVVAPGFDVRPPRMSAGYWSTLINSGTPDKAGKGFFRYR
jgi:hypothetical protein